MTHLCKSKTCPFSAFPKELLLMVGDMLPLKDLLSLSDTCMAYRSLISDTQCTKACTIAGLSIPSDVGPRAMAKLLCRPRVGVSNWSHEGGIPKAWLDFTKVWPISSAVREACRVDLHPTFTASKYTFLSEQRSFKQVRLRVAVNQPDILLVNHRLYFHEYATSPPLQDLRIIMKTDEGSIQHGHVAFIIRNPTGVTLGNYYQGLYRFFHQSPHIDMPLTEIVMNHYETCFGGYPIISLADDKSEDRGYSDDNVNPYFVRDCPTNLAMMDIWSKLFGKYEIFSEQTIRCELPFYRRSELALIIHITRAKIVRNPSFLQSTEQGRKWGEPRRCYHPQGQSVRIFELPCEDINKDFWDQSVPIIRF